MVTLQLEAYSNSCFKQLSNTKDYIFISRILIVTQAVNYGSLIAIDQF